MFARVLGVAAEELVGDDVHVERVDVVVAVDAPSRPRRRRRARRRRAPSAARRAPAPPAGSMRSCVGGERRRLVQIAHALGDVDRQVADALEVGDDLERQRDEAQIGGHRLAPRQDEKASSSMSISAWLTCTSSAITCSAELVVALVSERIARGRSAPRRGRPWPGACRAACAARARIAPCRCASLVVLTRTSR